MSADSPTPAELLLAVAALSGGQLPDVAPPPEPPPPAVPTKVRDQRLEELRALIPKLACKGHCQASCGPIPIGEAEYRRLVEATGGIGLNERPELAARAGAAHVVARGAVCPLLSDGPEGVGGRCSVYAQRPLICSLWGAVETMACPWGCVPEKYLTHRAGKALQALAAAIDPA